MNTNCDGCDGEFELQELQNWLCINCRPAQEQPIKDIDNLTCDICYNDRPRDMMIKCCDKKNIKVCECNVSICRRCADNMTLKCPTCRTKCDKFVYADEAIDKPIKVKKTKDNTTQRERPDLSRFIIGQDILVHNIGPVPKLWIRKARIVSINASSLSVQLYSYSRTYTELDEYNIHLNYRWTNKLQEKKICVKNLHRIRTRQDTDYLGYFESLEMEECLIV